MFYADLSPVIGSEQGGIRPVVIIQNDVGNKFSPTVIAAAIILVATICTVVLVMTRLLSQTPGNLIYDRN
jgi:mRNA-degrading endonuclease toxin of MazEF toxin-antitoxin module